jgi:hypothetical protein
MRYLAVEENVVVDQANLEERNLNCLKMRRWT